MATSGAKRYIGGHVGQDDPIGQAAVIGADAVQLFLGDPQGWKGPKFPHPDGAAGLKAQAEEAGVRIYVHSPYVLNLASTNNRIRIPSRKSLDQQVAAAAEIGAAGVVVHGGHVTKDDDPGVGYDNWRKAFEQIDAVCPILIENTAGGSYSMARRLESIALLWDAVGELGAGFCLDTCHAFAGGIELPEAADAITAITGRIDLIHANDSQGAFDSGRDRHANFGDGMIATDALVETIARTQADVICETPFPGVVEDIALLRERLN
ncbi:MAG: deoxyribonuclease-4 [Actinomycetes bacterium]|jgi:deoxyribonuclease-4